MHTYLKFGAMITTSTVVMFILMYLNVWSVGHVYWSETRAYMALLMGAAMALVMIAFMLDMYTNKRANIAVVAASLLIFVVSLFLARSQVTVGDVEWMRAMIPHHSIAILTSERAKITDPRVRKLADGIISAQKREIGEMQALIAELAKR